MPDMQESNQYLKKAGKRLIPNIIISWLTPLALYSFLHYFSVNDAYAFAISAAIPVIRIAVYILWRRKVDWIGVFGAAGFASAFLATTLSGGSSLPLKLYRPIITGLLGITLIVSVVNRKPLLLLIIKALRSRRSGGSINLAGADSQSSRKFAAGPSIKRLSVATALVGFIFLADAAIHIILALTMSTGEFMISSRAVTIVIVAALIGIRLLLGRRNKG